MADMADVASIDPESTSVRRYLAFGLTALSAVLVFAQFVAPFIIVVLRRGQFGVGERAMRPRARAAMD
jgi:hypothetical protein